MDIAVAIIIELIAVIFAVGAIGMALVRPARCPECGGRDTHEDADSHFWLGRRAWVCNDCEQGFEEE